MNEFYIPPVEISPYKFYYHDTYSQFLSSDYNPALMDYLYSFSNDLMPQEIYTISSLITPRTKRWRNKNLPDAIQVYAFGTFRSHYRAIVRAADVLTEFFEISSILPMIQPLTNIEWRFQLENQEMVFRRLQRHGVVLYDQE